MKTSINLKPVLDFLAGLQRANHKAWFEAHRTQYQEARDAFEAYVAAVIAELGPREGFGGLSPKDCIFRLNRDLRFSKDKTPYKTTMSAVIGPGGRKSHGMPYYVQIGPRGQSMLAGGLHMPNPQQLTQWRQAIDRDPALFKKLINGKEFVQLFGGVSGARLSGAPRGYGRDHPEIELLRLKEVTVVHSLEDQAVLRSTILPHTLRVFQAMKPFLRYLESIE
ncbi:MAG TPA: DUF2461 domain-containing protein [Anaerolineales bacterium]|nr:DUF2461 domain-containing protein [Anaerolineales bacterium]